MQLMISGIPSRLEMNRRIPQLKQLILKTTIPDYCRGRDNNRR
jgi:hypothetical protein